jgi:hypothetical protein
MLNLELLHNTNKDGRPKARAIKPVVAVQLDFLQQRTTTMKTMVENGYGGAVYTRIQLH